MGSFDSLSDALHITELTSATASHVRFTNHVGRGSSWHCFAADFFGMAVTSATVVGRRTDSGSVTDRSMIKSGAAAAVDERIRSILSVNNERSRQKSDKVTTVSDFISGGSLDQMAL